MRWLLLKDLQILRRSPLLVVLLIVYPIVIALLVGLAIDRPPGKPKVAFANLVPPGESEFSIGARKLDVADYAPRLFSSIDAVRVDTREEAIEKVRSGEVLGAIVLPEDATDRLRRTLALSGGDPPTIEVYYNASDPLKQQLVETTIRARLAEANDALSDAVLKEAAGYIDVIVTGGKVAVPVIGTIDILGLRRAAADHRGRAADAAEGGAGADRAHAGGPVRPPGRRQPRRFEADPGHDRHAGAPSSRPTSAAPRRR